MEYQCQRGPDPKMSAGSEPRSLRLLDPTGPRVQPNPSPGPDCMSRPSPNHGQAPPSAWASWSRWGGGGHLVRCGGVIVVRKLPAEQDRCLHDHLHLEVLGRDCARQRPRGREQKRGPVSAGGRGRRGGGGAGRPRRSLPSSVPVPVAFLPGPAWPCPKSLPGWGGGRDGAAAERRRSGGGRGGGAGGGGRWGRRCHRGTSHLCQRRSLGVRTRLSVREEAEK